MQARIQEAVLTEKGWESIPPELRAQADTAWFRSLLLFEPAKVMQKIEQPILIIQGDLDQQVFPHHADQLGALARTRKKSPPVEVVHLPGDQPPFDFGEIRRRRRIRFTLPDKNITPTIAKTIAEWLKK